MGYFSISRSPWSSFLPFFLHELSSPYLLLFFFVIRGCNYHVYLPSLSSPSFLPSFFFSSSPNSHFLHRHYLCEKKEKDISHLPPCSLPSSLHPSLLHPFSFTLSLPFHSLPPAPSLSLPSPFPPTTFPLRRPLRPGSRYGPEIRPSLRILASPSFCTAGNRTPTRQEYP